MIARLILCGLTGTLFTNQALAQAESRAGVQYDLGLGVGRLAGYYCSGCSTPPATYGPALGLRPSLALAPIIELGADLSFTAGGGRNLASLLGDVAVHTQAEYPTWIRVGMGVSRQPGRCDDVTVAFGGRADQCGGRYLLGAKLSVGLDVPLHRGWALGPMASYARTFSADSRYDVWVFGVHWRLR